MIRHSDSTSDATSDNELLTFTVSPKISVLMFRAAKIGAAAERPALQNMLFEFEQTNGWWTAIITVTDAFRVVRLKRPITVTSGDPTGQTFLVPTRMIRAAKHLFTGASAAYRFNGSEMSVAITEGGLTLHGDLYDPTKRGNVRFPNVGKLIAECVEPATVWTPAFNPAMLATISRFVDDHAGVVLRTADRPNRGMRPHLLTTMDEQTQLMIMPVGTP